MALSYPQPFWKGIVPRVLEAYLLRTVRVNTADSVVNIPPHGSLVCAFAPHSGWIESIVIDQCFSQADRAWPVWLTKSENRSLPGLLTGGRVLCIDRQCPEPSIVRAVHALLRHPGAALATSIEGTRFGNPLDPDDLLTLGTFETGAVRFAITTQVPILPVAVLGSERIAPRLENVWRHQGTVRAFHEIRGLLAHPRPVEVRFLPVYRDHLHVGNRLKGRRLREKAILHTSRLRERIVPRILELHPGYPCTTSPQPVT